MAGRVSAGERDLNSNLKSEAVASDSTYRMADVSFPCRASGLLFWRDSLFFISVGEEPRF